MKTLRLSSILIAFIFAATASMGQDLKADLKKMAETYESLKSFELELEYELYQTHSSTEIFESDCALLKRKEQQYYTKMFSMESIVNAKYVILIDHDSRLFMIDHLQKAASQQQSLSQVIMADSTIQRLQESIGASKPMIRKVDYQLISSKEAAYTIYFNEGELTKQQLQFYLEDHTLSKVVLYYRTFFPIAENQEPTQPRIEITYKELIKDSIIPDSFFQEKNYATIKKDQQLDLAAAYRGYTVINHLLQLNTN